VRAGGWPRHHLAMGVMGLWARLPAAAHVAVGVAGVALVVGPVLVAAQPSSSRHGSANGDATEFDVGSHPQKTGAHRTADLLAGTCATTSVMPTQTRLHIDGVVDRCATVTGAVTQRLVQASGFVQLDLKPATGPTVVVKVYARGKTCPVALAAGQAHDLTCMGDVIRNLTVGSDITVTGPLVRADGRAGEMLPVVKAVVDQAAAKKPVARRGAKPVVRHRRRVVVTTTTATTTAAKP